MRGKVSHDLIVLASPITYKDLFFLSKHIFLSMSLIEINFASFGFWYDA